MTAKQILNKEIAYEFKDNVKIDLTFSSDTALYWKEKKSGSDADEVITTIHINDNTTLTGWVEKDKAIVSLYSDFEKGETYGYQYFRDGKIRSLIGTITLKDKGISIHHHQNLLNKNRMNILQMILTSKLKTIVLFPRI